MNTLTTAEPECCFCNKTESDTGVSRVPCGGKCGKHICWDCADDSEVDDDDEDFWCNDCDKSKEGAKKIDSPSHPPEQSQPNNMTTSAVLVRYSYEQMEACPGSTDILVRRNYFEDGGAGKYINHYYKMLKWNRKSAWLINCDINGKTDIGGGEKYAMKDVPRMVMKMNAPLLLTC